MAIKRYDDKVKVSDLTKAPARVNTPNRVLSPKQKDYVKKLGYTPTEIPEFRSDKKPTGIVDQVFDILGRPVSGVSSGVSKVYERGRNKETDMGLLNLPIGFAEGLVEGALGDRKQGFSSTISTMASAPENRANPTSKSIDDARGIAGFGLDLVLDPTNLIPIGKGASLIKKGLTKADDALAGGKVASAIAKGASAVRETPLFNKVASSVSRTYGRTEDFVKALDDMKMVENRGNQVAEGVNKLLNGTIDKRGLQDLKIDLEGFLKVRGKEGLLDTITKQIDTAFESTKKLGKVDQEELFKTLTKVGADIDTGKTVTNNLAKVTNDYDKLATPVRTIIDETLTPELVQKGLITAEQAQEGSGSYLRYLYQKLGIPEEEGIMTGASKAAKIGSESGALQERMTDVKRFFQAVDNGTLPQNVDQNQLLALRDQFIKIEKASGQKEATSQIQNALELLVGKDNISNIAYQERVARGLVNDASVVAPVTIEQTNRLIERYSFLDWTSNTIAKSFDSEASAKAAGYSLIPNTDAFGNLKGKFVPSAIADDIKGLYNPKSEFAKNLKSATDIWKKLKLYSPFNTATNSRNFVSNIFLNSVVEDGIPLYRMDIYAKASNELEKGGKFYEEARKGGLFLNSFANQEARNQLGKQSGNLLKKANSIIDNGVEIAGRKIPFASTKGARIPYTPVGFGREATEWTESMGKLAQFMYQRNKGKSVEESIRIAEKALFNYSKLPTAIASLRDTMVPFISFKYFATQLAIDTLINRTSKITNFAKGLNAIESVTSDRENERDLPDYIKQNRTLNLRTPWLDEKGNPKYLDLSFLYPFGDVAGGFEPVDFVNPFAKTALELNTNRNFFFNQDIVKPSSTNPALDQLGYAVQQLGPKSPIIPGSADFTKILSALEGKTDQYGRANDLFSTVANSFLGLKAQNIDPQLQRTKNINKNESQQREVTTEINRIKKNQSLTPEQKQQQISGLRQMISQIKQDINR